MAARFAVNLPWTWDATAGTKWALTSGGAGGQAVPTTNDTVTFDANSGSGICTVSGARVCSFFTVDNAFTGTITGTATPTITFSGSVALGTGMTLDVTSSGPVFIPAGSANVNFNSAGKMIRALQFNNANAIITLQAPLDINVDLTLLSGTMNLAGFATSASSFISSNGNARGLNLGGATFTVNGANGTALWNTAVATNFTLTPGSGGNIIFNTPIAAGYTIATGALDLNLPVMIAARGNAAARLSLAASVFSNLVVIGPNAIDLSANVTIDDADLQGSAGGIISLISSVPGTSRTITVSGSVLGRHVACRDITKSGGTMSFAPGFDLGNNAGIVFNPNQPSASYQLGI